MSTRQHHRLPIPMRCAAMLLMLALALTAPAGAATVGDDPDCGTTADAGDSMAARVPLRPAEYGCYGELPVGDEDWFGIPLMQGGALRLDGVGGSVGADLYDPAGALLASPVGPDPVPITLDGTYSLRLYPAPGRQTVYSLTFYSRTYADAGRNEIPTVLDTYVTPLHGITSLLGPEHDGLDGAWRALPAVAEGGENVYVDEGGISFYDAERRPIAWQCSIACAVPAGAAWVLLTAFDPAIETFPLPSVDVEGTSDWAFQYHY